MRIGNTVINKRQIVDINLIFEPDMYHQIQQMHSFLNNTAKYKGKLQCTLENTRENCSVHCKIQWETAVYTAKYKGNCSVYCKIQGKKAVYTAKYKAKLYVVYSAKYKAKL